MAIICEKYANVKPLEDFDWSLYEDGWNGKSLKANTKVKTPDGGKVYCHEPYANKLYSKYFGKNSAAAGYDVVPKDLHEGDVIRIKDVALIGDDELLISTSAGGSAIVNLAKENKFIDMFNITKEHFKSYFLGTEEGKKTFLNQGYLAKIEKNGKASLFDGTLIKTELEFKEQIALGDKANRGYNAKVVGANKGGLIVDVQGIRCFMPAGQISSNKVSNFESLVGTDTEVMIMKYIEGRGFLVSRKMYLDKVRPSMIQSLRETWEQNPEVSYRGVITGARHFGIFVELNEFYTGLLHKTYVMPEDYEKLKGTEDDIDGNARRNFPVGTEIEVKIFSVSDDNTKIVLTNILDKNMRDVIVEQRVKAEEEEDARKKEEEKKLKELQEMYEKKQMANKAAKNFKGEVVSLEDLANL